MFEISWSELLILGIVTLIFVGPKELPVFLRTLGRYAGSIKRQANEFRAQFDDAMRVAELDSMKKEMEAMQASVNAEVMSATRALDDVSKTTNIAQPAVTPPAPAPAIAASAPRALEPALPMPPMPAPPRMEP
ncbi:MAG: Sec-independent protein translocase protein TatB [Hyphomicrobium sp.]